MSAAQTAQDLTELAHSQDDADRGRLILAIVDLCARSQNDARSPQVRALLDPIFLNLVGDAEFQIRQRLAAAMNERRLSRNRESAVRPGIADAGHATEAAPAEHR